MIADYLYHGEEHAVSVVTLSSLTGLSDREIRERISRERKCGILICYSMRGGYYIARTRDEIERFARASAARERTARQVSKPFRDALKKMDAAAQIHLCPDP